MTRSELRPALRLQHDIAVLWVVEEPAIGPSSPDVLPDPYRELIVNCGAPLFLEVAPGRQAALPRAFLNDLHRQPLRFRSAGPCCLLGVRFYPWAILTGLDLQPALAAPSIRPLGGPWPGIAADLIRLVHTQGVAAAIHALHRILQTRYRISQPDALLVAVIHGLLGAPHAPPRIRDLALDTALSLRQFERRFKQATGVPPKLLARLVRFEAAYAAITSRPGLPMAALAATFGYADQAHMIHDFQALAAQTPTQLERLHPADPPDANDVAFFQDTPLAVR